MEARLIRGTSDVAAVVDALVDQWCERRALRALRHVLGGWPSALRLTDDWTGLRSALRNVLALARSELAPAEVTTIEEVVVAIDKAIPTASAAACLQEKSMPRRRISSGSPYEASVGCSRAVVVGDRIVTSGTAPIWPDGRCEPDVTVQARRCLDIILTALAEGGASAEDVVRTRIYLADAADVDAVSRVHGEVFGSIRPANTMVVVAAFVDPRWRLEMEAEAIVGSA